MLLTHLQSCGKSCRLQWTNYLRPDLKHGEFTESKEQTIVKLHSVVGNRWSLIAAQLPGRTDNDVKNHWNTKLKKKLSGMGIDPVTHKPFSHLMAEIANTLPPPQVAHLIEASLGCFKDEMLHLLTKKHVDFSSPPPLVRADLAAASNNKDTIQKIKLGLSRAIMVERKAGSMGEPSDGLVMMSEMYHAVADEFRYDGGMYGHDGDGSGWSQSMCTPGAHAVEGSNRVAGCMRTEAAMAREMKAGRLAGKMKPACSGPTLHCGIYLRI